MFKKIAIAVLSIIVCLPQTHAMKRKAKKDPSTTAPTKKKSKTQLQVIAELIESLKNNFSQQAVKDLTIGILDVLDSVLIQHDAPEALETLSALGNLLYNEKIPTQIFQQICVIATTKQEKITAVVVALFPLIQAALKINQAMECVNQAIKNLTTLNPTATPLPLVTHIPNLEEKIKAFIIKGIDQEQAKTSWWSPVSKIASTVSNTVAKTTVTHLSLDTLLSNTSAQKQVAQKAFTKIIEFLDLINKFVIFQWSSAKISIKDVTTQTMMGNFEVLSELARAAGIEEYQNLSIEAFVKQLWQKMLGLNIKQTTCTMLRQIIASIKTEITKDHASSSSSSSSTN